MSGTVGSTSKPIYLKDGVFTETSGGGGGVPIGTIIAWPGSSAPTEGGTWLLCNGQSCAAYPALVAIVGSTVPNLNGRFLEGTTGTPRSFKSAGLPNITGSAVICSPWTGASGSGCLWTNSGSGTFVEGQYPQTYTRSLYIDASKSSSIYGASTTVQPASYTVMYYIKAA